MLGQQLEVEGEGDENVLLYYYITVNIQIQFGREEFCLVTGLRFGVENLADNNGSELPIPFRRRVFPSCYDSEHITGYMVLEIIQDEVFDRLHAEDAVSLCCLGILQLVLLSVEVKRRIPDWMLRNLPAARLTPDETEARSKWWISSRAYFHDAGPSNWQSQMPEQSATPYWQPAFPSHPGTYNWQSSVPFDMGNPNLQPPIERHHDAARNAFDDENERGSDVIFLGGQFTGNYLVYENVDPEKVKREEYVNYTEFLNDPHQIYLDYYMKGYSVSVTF
nr:phospholipase-like protein [Tanacetum cinerariifolium]